MAITVGNGETHRFEFSATELAGALGDSVTVLPVVIALGVLTPVSLPHVLLSFGVFQVVWGVRYGVPMSVEPMKALAGLTIAGAMSYAELMAAGLLAGVALLAAGRAGWLARVERYVGEPVVRGVQLAVALLLARAGLDLAAGDLVLAASAGAAVLALGWVGYREASALVVLGAATGLAALSVGTVDPSLPSVAAFPAGAPALTRGAAEGAVAQLAMTVGNAAVATALLVDDFFEVEVSPDALARSMGAMTLVAVPFGGLPMCHGSGGLAGKYAFGARTGGANVILGLCYVLAALVAGVVAAFPAAVLGVLLGVVALQLARTALSTEDAALTILVGVAGAFANVGLAFVAGAVVHRLRRRRAR